jgi:hypothetical protein
MSLFQSYRYILKPQGQSSLQTGSYRPSVKARQTSSLRACLPYVRPIMCIRRNTNSYNRSAVSLSTLRTPLDWIFTLVKDTVYILSYCNGVQLTLSFLMEFYTEVTGLYFVNIFLMEFVRVFHNMCSVPFTSFWEVPVPSLQHFNKKETSVYRHITCFKRRRKHRVFMNKIHAFQGLCWTCRLPFIKSYSIKVISRRPYVSHDNPKELGSVHVCLVAYVIQCRTGSWMTIAVKRCMEKFGRVLI